MKQSFLIILLVVSGAVYSFGQCSVAVCNKTGVWGVVYNDGKAPVATMDELKQLAIRQCGLKGGTNCREFYTMEAKGCWYAFMIGTGDDGRFTYRAIAGEKSKEEAESAI